MKITPKDLERWKKNSLKLARRLSYNQKTLDYLQEHVTLNLVSGLPEEGYWFGKEHVDKNKPAVTIWERNISTESFASIQSDLEKTGMYPLTLLKITRLIRNMSQRNFYDLFNQSCMDHEIIGHLYNYLEGNAYDEHAASQVQIDFAYARAESRWNFIHKESWRKISTIMKLLISYHKHVTVF